MSDAFAAIADAYDLLLDEQRLARELPAIQTLIGPAARCCDLGCGTADHLAGLVAGGITGCGIDAEQAMVDRALARHPGLDIRLGDIAQPPAGPWDALLCLGNVLACIDGPAVPAMLAAWAAVLAPGGRLLIQLVNPLRTLEDSSLTRRDEQRILIKQLTGIPGGALLSLVLHQRDGQGWRSHASHQHLHHHHPDELHATCLRVGFDQVACYGALDQRPYSDEAPNLVLLATRTKE